jgi:hypothetical protein
LFTLRWLASHALMVVLVAGMLGLGAWQLSRATGGNMLSWAYTIQWPIFAGFVVFIWWREVRRTLHGVPEPRHAPLTRQPVFSPAQASAYEDDDDPALAAYNHYLAWLSANPGRRPADYPGAMSAASPPPDASRGGGVPAAHKED